MIKCDDAALAALLNTCDDVGEQDTDVSEHVESCKHCQARLSELAADAEQWDAVSQWLSPGAVNSEIYSESLDAQDRWKRPTAWSETMAKSLLSAASHPEMLGRIGRYDVERLIGSGGMGVVFKAYDTELNRPVAVKLLAPYLASNGAARKRFAREARAAAAVVDDHVVPIHNVETESEHPFLVMKFIGGGSLQQRIDREGPLDVCEVLRIGMQTAKGLAAAHAQGLIHRDVKPSNILLDEGVDRALLTDFGLARASDDASLTRSGFHPGTPHYMSPEQVRGEAIDGRSDLFGLGCVLYSLCTGHPPFRAETSYAVLRRIIDDSPRSIRETNPEVPEWLERVVMKLLAKSAVDRFDSAAQVAELLEGCLAHVQKPTAIPLPVGVQALAAQTHLRAVEIPKPNRLKAIHQRIPPFAKYIAAAAGAFALFFAGILIVLELDKGTLTIESEIDDVPIRIMQGDEVVKSLTVSKEGATTRIGAGKYIVEIGQEFDKAVIKDGGVELSRGATAIVKVTQSNADTAEDEKAKDEAAKAWLRRPVVGSTHDGKSFQLAGHDALMDCVMRNNSETLNRLLTVDKYDLDFSPRDGQWTLLQIALLHECVETTSLLLQHGANPNFASKGTPLPLEIAKRSGRNELVALVQRYLVTNAPQTNMDVRQIYADIDGEVTKILVGHNSVVIQGQNLLEMRNDDLKLELTKTADQMKESSLQLDGITKKFQDNKDLTIDEVIKMEKDRSELQKHVAALSVQLKKLKDRCELLYVKSTVDGKVITKNVEQLLKNRSVVAGQVLLEIAIEPSRNNTEKTANHTGEDGGVVTIPLKAEWIPEEWLKCNLGRRHLTIVADGIIQDEAKPNVVNRVQRGILHDCRLESYEKMSRDGVEYWKARLFVPRKPMYSIGALWFKDAIDTYRIGDRHTPVPSPDLTQDNPQVKLDEAMKEGHVFRLDYVNDDFENNLPMVKSQRAESTSIQETADSLVTITFTGTTDGASITASGNGWRVDDAGHILLPSHVVPKCDDEAIQLRYASGVRCSATRLKTLGHLTLLKSDQVVNGPAISLDSETSLTSGDAVSAILNGTDNVPGSIVKPRTTIALSELDGVKVNPELRFQNIITTDFVAGETTLSGAPLLTKSGNVAGMIIRLGSAQLIAIPVAEIREVLKQLQQLANFDPIRDHGLSTDSIEARADGRFGTLKIIEPTSLEDVVTKFNLLAKAHPLGRSQPGLTVEEMTAAFWLWIASDECNEATRKDFQQVLDTQMLRPGHILQFNTKFETDGHLFEVWSIQFGDDKSAAWFKIRDSKLLSRLKTDEERRAWEQRIDQMKKSFHEYKRWGDRPKADDTNPADNEPKDATKDSAVTLPPMEFDTLEDFLKPGKELFDKEMKQIDERLAKVVEGSAEHSLLTTKKKQLQQQWDLSVAQVKGMAAAAKAGNPVQLAPIVIPNNSRPWQAPMPDPLLGHDEDIAKVLAGTWQVKRYVEDGEEPPVPIEGSTVTFSKNMIVMHLKAGDKQAELQQVYRIGNDKIDIWDMDSGPDIRTARPHMGSYSIENDLLRICYHDRAMELETPQSRPPVQPGKGFVYLELQRRARAMPNNTQSAIPDTQNELDAKLVPLVSELADRVALGSIKTLVVEYEISHSRGAPVDLSQIESSFDTGSLARYSNYPAKLCLDRESGNGFFSGKDAYEFQIARNERIGKSLVHCENPVQATLLSPSDVTIRGQYAGYDKRVTNPFFNNRSLEDVLRDLIRGHDFLDEKSPKIWFRIVEDSDSLFRFEVVDHAVFEKVGNEIPLQDRERVAATYQVNIDRFQVTLDKRLNWAMTELVRYGCQSGQEGLEHGTAKIGERIFFAEHVLMDGVWLPKSIRRFVGYSDETILVELAVKHLSVNEPNDIIDTLQFPRGSRVSDDREGESTGSLPLLPKQFEELVKTIQQLGPSTTYEEFIKATKVDKGGSGCDEHSSSGVSRSRFTWWMEDGYSLHALIDEHPHSITNRFSCAGISKSGKLIWSWANNPDDLNTIDGLELREAAKDCRPSSGEENSSKGSVQKNDSELATGRAAMLSVAKGETDDLRLGQSYKIDLLVLASDDLKPVAGASVDVTLIEVYKGVAGDGGFAGFKTNEKGIATVDKVLWPGRYQIRVRAPEGSRFRDTEFAKEETILVVHEDGRYSPREFRLAVDENKSPK